MYIGTNHSLCILHNVRRCYTLFIHKVHTGLRVSVINDNENGIKCKNFLALLKLQFKTYGGSTRAQFLELPWVSNFRGPSLRKYVIKICISKRGKISEIFAPFTYTKPAQSSF